MRVFIGTNENCGMINYLSKGFEALGHVVTTLVKNEHRFSYSGDYTIKVIIPKRNIGNVVIRKFYSEIDKYRQVRLLKNHFENLMNNDLFIYMWDTILPDFEDIKRLRKLNKRVVFIFIGSDVRHASAFMQEFPNNKISWTPYFLAENLNIKLRFIRNVELFANQIYSVPDQAGLQILPYNHFFLPFDFTSLPFHFPDNDDPVIVHAPSNPSIKGTPFILNALEKLKEEGLKFTLKLLQNLNNAEVKEALGKADIALDQVHLHGPGMFGLEAMASGCALATNFMQKYTNIFAPPVCYIDDTDILVENLRTLITDKAFRKKLAYAGRKFVEENNSPTVIAQSIIENLNKSNTIFDYTPTFFLDNYQLHNVRLTHESKKLNELVVKKLNPDIEKIYSLRQRELI